MSESGYTALLQRWPSIWALSRWGNGVAADGSGRFRGDASALPNAADGFSITRAVGALVTPDEGTASRGDTTDLQ